MSDTMYEVYFSGAQVSPGQVVCGDNLVLEKGLGAPDLTQVSHISTHVWKYWESCEHTCTWAHTSCKATLTSALMCKVDLGAHVNTCVCMHIMLAHRTHMQCKAVHRCVNGIGRPCANSTEHVLTCSGTLARCWLLPDSAPVSTLDSSSGAQQGFL